MTESHRIMTLVDISTIGTTLGRWTGARLSTMRDKLWDHAWETHRAKKLETNFGY